MSRVREDKHYIGEVGLSIVVNCGQDISSYTDLKMEVKKPDGTLVEWSAIAYEYDSETIYIRYITVAGDLDQAGEYTLQAYGKHGGWEGLGRTDYFVVYDEFA